MGMQNKVLVGIVAIGLAPALIRGATATLAMLWRPGSPPTSLLGAGFVASLVAFQGVLLAFVPLLILTFRSGMSRSVRLLLWTAFAVAVGALLTFGVGMGTAL